jgi:hypothetical protein
VQSPGTLFCIFKIVLLIQGAMEFDMNIRISFSIPAKKLQWDFPMDCIESVDCFGEFCDLNNI